jgi:hypothetical protein
VKKLDEKILSGALLLLMAQYIEFCYSFFLDFFEGVDLFYVSVFSFKKLLKKGIN